MTSAEVLELTGITYRQLWWWTERGYIKPTGKTIIKHSGSGYPYAWTQEDVKLIKKIKLSLDRGYKLQAAVKIANQ